MLGVPAGTLIAGFAGGRMAFAAIGGVALLSGLAQLLVLPRLPPPAPGVRQLTYLLRHSDARLGLLTIAFVRFLLIGGLRERIALRLRA